MKTHDMGIDHAYEPDFLVRLRNSVTVVVEVVNNWGQLGE
jgi:hypothetical protein